MNQNIVIKKGSIILVTDGEYSDYETIMFCKAIADIDVIALRSEYMALYPEQKKPYSFEEFNFCKWLVVDKKICEELNCFEWNLGGYAEADFSIDSIGPVIPNHSMLEKAPR